jgi:hypothetical protein
VPSEIIKKTRVDDINIKKGTDNHLIKSDFRISSSFEQNANLNNVNSPQSSIRHKERTSYKFFWMTFDLTVTQGVNI